MPDMVARLVLDLVRRRWWWGLLMVGQFSFAWSLASKPGHLKIQVGMIFVWAVIFGPNLTGVEAVPREVRHLPVARRQLWWMQWLGMVPVPAVFVLAASLPGAALARWNGRDPVGVDTAVLGSVLAFILAGAVTAIATAKPAVRPEHARPGEGFWRFYRLAGGVLVSAAIVAGAFGLGGGLPLEWAALTPGTLVGLALGASVAVVGAVRGPGPDAFIDIYSLGAPTPPALPTPSTHPRRVGIVGRLLARGLLLFLRRRRRFDDPFTGLPQLYWWTWRTKALPLVVLFVCMMPSVAVGMALSSAPGGLVAKFVRLWNAGPEPSLMILGFMLLVARIEIVVRMSLPLNNLANFVTGTSRHLRVLPVASSRLVAFLIFRRAAGWANLWAAAMIMHLLVAGVPSQLRLDWLLCVIGVDTLLDAATYYGSRVLLVSTYGLVASAWFVVAYGVNWSADSLVTASVPVVAVLVGAVAFAAAVVAHRWSVTSGTGLYQSEGVA